MLWHTKVIDRIDAHPPKNVQCERDAAGVEVRLNPMHSLLQIHRQRLPMLVQKNDQCHQFRIVLGALRLRIRQTATREQRIETIRNLLVNSQSTLLSI